MNRPYLYAALLLLTQCSKCKDDPKPGQDKLPPVTQEGENTFGCLLNGQVWTPRGNDGFSNYTVDYDPTRAQGTLSIAAARIRSATNDHQTLGLFSDSIQATGTYRLRTQGRHGAGMMDVRTGCQYYAVDASTYCRGRLTLTRLDRQAGIVAGTFEFVLAKPGCDTVRVTEGRFDKKL
ncbi:hypothetical protein EJV47_08465 [Hymenobacter gummosus]|uniref:Uncharacterized protein n=1 Tax=Hymenobacter gummosus TaxID=1776032 RepID=A0A431U3Z8_9BACT|nr:hypothetical protein [Hymenobacter gummosus]RTQ50657.1 hypothetical protein EJV47_08465 [Hymenobacter gummosus]